MADPSPTIERADPRVWLSRILQCPSEAVADDSSIVTHPGWDSFAQVEIMIHLETHYGIEMNEETVARYTSFEAILELHDEQASPLRPTPQA